MTKIVTTRVRRIYQNSAMNRNYVFFLYITKSKQASPKSNLTHSQTRHQTHNLMFLTAATSQLCVLTEIRQTAHESFQRDQIWTRLNSFAKPLERDRFVTQLPPVGLPLSPLGWRRRRRCRTRAGHPRIDAAGAEVCKQSDSLQLSQTPADAVDPLAGDRRRHDVGRNPPEAKRWPDKVRTGVQLRG